MKKKKLLITTDCFVPRWDGIARFLLELLPFLVKEYNVTILAPDFGALDEDQFPWLKNVTLIRYPLFPVQFGDIYFSNVPRSEIAKHVREADLIFNQTLGPIGMYALASAKKYDKKVVSYVHTLDWELAIKSVKRGKFLSYLFGKWLVRRQFNKCTFLFVPTSEVAEKLTFLGVHTEKKVLSLGTDPSLFVPSQHKVSVRKKLGLRKDHFVVGYVGRIGREKDLGTLYKAFKRLEKKYEHVKLLIVGKGVREEEKRFKSKRNVLFVGEKNDVVPYLQAMDVYVLPSLTETTSLSTLEALSCGVPVLSTPVGYVKEYIREKVNGMFFPFGNSLILFMKMEMLFKDPQLRHTMGLHARKTIVKDFNIKKSVQEIVKVLKGI
jgi:1,2-diacylglycerol 3-alpha-glucosyltransferase